MPILRTQLCPYVTKLPHKGRPMSSGPIALTHSWYRILSSARQYALLSAPSRISLAGLYPPAFPKPLGQSTELTPIR